MAMAIKLSTNDNYFCFLVSTAPHQQKEGHDGPVSLTWLPDKFAFRFRKAAMAAILDILSERF